MIGFLRCFPCMERLYIQIQPSPRKDMENLWRYDTLDPIECLEVHLTTIVLNSWTDVNFARFFVLNANLLKVMEFGVCGSCDEKWMANQHRQPQLDNRASRDARFDYDHDSVSYRFCFNKHMHDMRIDDPFGSSLWKSASTVPEFTRYPHEIYLQRGAAFHFSTSICQKVAAMLYFAEVLEKILELLPSCI